MQSLKAFSFEKISPLKIFPFLLLLPLTTDKQGEWRQKARGWCCDRWCDSLKKWDGQWIAKKILHFLKMINEGFILFNLIIHVITLNGQRKTARVCFSWKSRWAIFIKAIYSCKYLQLLLKKSKNQLSDYFCYGRVVKGTMQISLFCGIVNSALRNWENWNEFVEQSNSHIATLTREISSLSGESSEAVYFEPQATEAAQLNSKRSVKVQRKGSDLRTGERNYPAIGSRKGVLRCISKCPMGD